MLRHLFKLFVGALAWAFGVWIGLYAFLRTIQYFVEHK